MSELMPIGEFSALCQLSVKMLRHYDEIGLLTPAHVDAVNGYRSYSPAQIAVAVVIRELRGLDMPLGEIRSLVGSAAPADAHDILARHRDRLAEQLRASERRLVLIERMIAKECPMPDITEVDLPSQRVATRTVEGPNAMAGPLITTAFHELFAALQRQQVQPVGPPIQVVRFGDEDRFEQDACLPIAPDATLSPDIHVRTLDAGSAAVTRHRGPLDEANLVVHSVMGWVDGRGHRPVMPFRVALLAMPPLFTLPEFSGAHEPVVEIAVPFEYPRPLTAP